MSSTLWRARRRGERPVIYGRDREHARLRELLDDAIDGHGSLVLISGEAGIGKTTLVDDLIHEAEQRNCLVLTGGCYDLTTTPPYGPWVEVIRSYSPGDDDPALPSWFGNPEELERVGSQTALFEETRVFFVAVAEFQPLVIVLEDLHWSDPASLDALRYLGRTLRESSTLIVATYRDDEITRRDHLSQLLPMIVREAGAIRIGVGRLDRSALGEVIGANYELVADDLRRLVDYVADLSEGNPLYIGELLHELTREGAIRQADDSWNVGELHAVTVPPLIQQMIERRLERLDTETIELLDVAAIVGHEFDFATWAEASEGDEDVLLETLESAQRSGILEEINRSGRFRFHHALVREALYDRQAWPRRRELHRRVGTILSQQEGADIDAVAHHFQIAGDERAPDWLIRAGERAVQTFAWLMAVDFYLDAVRILEQRSDGARKRAELLDRVALLHLYENPRKGLIFVEEALQLAANVDDEPLNVSLRAHRGLLRCFAGHIRDGIADMHDALGGFEGDHERLIPGNSGWMPHIQLANWFANAGHLRAALELWETSNRESFDRDSTWWLGAGRAYAMLGDPAKAQDAVAISRDHSQSTNQHLGLLSTTASDYYYVHIPYFSDRPSERVRLVEQDALAGRYLRGIIESEQNQRMAEPKIMSYQFDTNWERIVRFTSRAREITNAFWAQYAMRALAEAARLRGDVQTAWAQVRDLHPEGAATEPGNCNFRAGEGLQITAARLCIASQDFEQAECWLVAHDGWMEWSDAVLGLVEGQLAWATYHRALGDPKLARESAEHALNHASNPRQPLALIAADRFLGQLDVDEEKYDDARGRLDASLELAERCEAPFEQALTMVVMAERAPKLGEVDEARRLIGWVREICEPLGAKPTLERVDEIEAMLPRVRRSSEDHPFGLTGREVEVLRLVARGRTDAEAAEELFISPRTVSQHLRNAYNKIGVNNRAEATRVAVERGIV